MKILLICLLSIVASAQVLLDELTLQHSFPRFNETLILNSSSKERDAPFTSAWWVDMTVTVGCLIVGGLMSGLTIGLASIDHLLLEIAAQ